MISGSPPTERNARTGLFTPPTSSLSPRSKISRERRRSTLDFVGVALIPSPTQPLRLQPSCDILRVIRQDNVRPSPLNPRQDFQHHPLLVQPALFGRGLHHRVLPAHVVSSHGNIKRVAHSTNHIQIR